MLLATDWTSPIGTQFGRSLGATTHQFTDNLSMARGSHILKAGLNLSLGTQSNNTLGDNGNSTGIYPNVFFGRNFGNVPDASIGPPPNAISPADRVRFENLYNDLLGRMAQVRQVFSSDLVQFRPPGTARVRNFRTREAGIFLQDDWKVRRNLTINFGIAL